MGRYDGCLMLVLAVLLALHGLHTLDRTGVLHKLYRACTSSPPAPLEPLSEWEVMRLLVAGPDPMPGVHMVYMYVNGSDPRVVGPRTAAGGPPAAGSRDRDNGELRFSLRSLDKFAPWFRGKVIILQGDDKPPYWLNTSHPRVMVINHKDFFANASVLPTFNSDAIHTNIHLVPPIVDADIFINWGDDVFLGSPVLPSDWVRDGKPVVYHEPGAITHGWDGYVDLKANGQEKWLAKVYRTRGLLEREFPRAAWGIRMNFVKHSPHPFSVRVLRELAALYKAEYELTQTFKFRAYDAVDVTTLHDLYCQINDACVYDPQPVVDDAAHLSELSDDDKSNYQELLRVFAFQPPKFFTFNDGFSDEPPRSADFVFQELLPAMFPTPSQYELSLAGEASSS